MGYVYDDVTGRIAAIFLTDTPTPPAGHTYDAGAIDNGDIVDSKRDIGGGVLKKRDGVKIQGSNGVPVNSVGSIIIQKFDGETLFDLSGAGDDDALTAVLESEGGFLEAQDVVLSNGAASFKVAAPALAESARLFLYSGELQLFDSLVVFN